MLTKAIEKLRSEMTQNTANSYIQVIGGFLLQHIENNPQDAEKILVDDKTIGKSLEEMWKEAKKKQSKNIAMFTPQEGFEIVMKYFGIEAPAPVKTTAPPLTPALEPTKSTIDFDVRLEDLF